MRRGISAAEVLLAVAVFVLATLPVLSLFSQEGRARRQSADRALALGIAHGTVESYRAGARDNAHLAPALALDPPVKLQAPPPGHGLSGYAELEGVRAWLGSKARGVDSTGTVLDVSLSTEWSARGEERELTVAFSLPRDAPPADAPEAVLDRARLDEDVRVALFPDAPGPGLARALGLSGAHAERMRILGEMCVLVDQLGRSRPAGPEPAAGPQLFRWARAHEAQAARLVAAMVYLGGRLEPIAGLTARDLGTPPVPPERFRPQAERLSGLAGELARELSLSLAAYRRVGLSADPAVSPRARLRAVRRGVEVAKLAALTGTPGALEPLAGLLRALASEGERRPDLAAFARVELPRARSLTTLRDGYGARARLEGISRYDRVMIRSRTRLLEPF